MKVRIVSVPVEDQEKALRFYTEILGFIKKREILLGEYKWLTVVSAEETDLAEILLEPMAFPPAKVYQKALYEAKIPSALFLVSDARQEFERLREAGVKFLTEPVQMGPVIIAVFDDTCGNYIQIFQPV